MPDLVAYGGGRIGAPRYICQEVLTREHCWQNQSKGRHLCWLVYCGNKTWLVYCGNGTSKKEICCNMIGVTQADTNGLDFKN